MKGGVGGGYMSLIPSKNLLLNRCAWCGLSFLKYCEHVPLWYQVLIVASVWCSLNVGGALCSIVRVIPIPAAQAQGLTRRSKHAIIPFAVQMCAVTSAG